jgi:hypothetical protein
MTITEEKREYNRQYRKRNKEKIKTYVAKYWKENKETVQEYRKRYQKRYAEFYKERSKQHKLTVLIHYSGNPPKCACCGENHIEFLTVDHEGGGGCAHRREVKRYGSAYYAWLIKNNYPVKLRVLCMNCNFATRFGETCPHEREF